MKNYVNYSDIPQPTLHTPLTEIIHAVDWLEQDCKNNLDDIRDNYKLGFISLTEFLSQDLATVQSGTYRINEYINKAVEAKAIPSRDYLNGARDAQILLNK